LKVCAVAFLLVAVFVPLQAAAGAVGTPAEMDPTASDVLDRYVKAIQLQESRAQAVSMDVDMDADLPQLKKHGRFHAFRFITRLGQVFYDKRRFEGDGTIKKEVIGRYLQAEKDAKSEYGSAAAVTPANYKFKYKGMTDYAGRPAYVFQVSPRKKRLGLYKGELWVDKETDLPLRQWGELVRNPSMFLKSVYFVRDYTICDGVSVPRRLISDVGTRLFGKAHLTIWYENVKVGEPAVATTAQSADGGHN
jgi:MucB/RseB N-terminal domain